MAKPKKGTESQRYGIGEWYGHILADLDSQSRLKFSAIGGRSQSVLPCPFRLAADPGAICKKKGGVCTLRRHAKDENGSVSATGPFVTLCPSRFWSNNDLFRWVGTELLGVELPTLVKEVQFLSSIVDEGEDDGVPVGRIDTILVDPNNRRNWCALEMQAVYFSGDSMSSHFAQYAGGETELFFPDKNRRPDFRSSGPKRLMPQLQIKVPTLRRWGKKMAVVIDRPFLNSLGKMISVKDVSNADIAWFVVDYEQATGAIHLAETIFTTLENSVEALTAGIPLSLPRFESEIDRFLDAKNKKLRSKVIRLNEPPERSSDGGSSLKDGAELPPE